MKLKGSIIVILEVVIAIVVGVTIGFNFLKANNDNTNNNNQENNVHLNKILTDEKSNSFYGIYNENDLVINKNQNNGVISISGLKNKNIEKKVNDKIKSFNTKYLMVEANFGNILSFTSSWGDGLENYYNVNLNTGEEMLLKDLFINNVDYVEIIKNNALKSTAHGYVGYKITDDGINDIENDNIFFYFNNISVHITSKTTDESFEIQISDCFEQLNIFTGFLTEDSIFENEEIGNKNLRISVPNGDSERFYIFRLKDYGYIDITIDENFSPFEDVLTKKESKLIRQHVQNEVLNQIANVKEDEFFVVTGKVHFINKELYNGIKFLTSGGLNICKISKEEFNSAEFKRDILNSRGGISGIESDKLNDCSKLPTFAIYYNDEKILSTYYDVLDIFTEEINAEEFLNSFFGKNDSNYIESDRKYVFYSDGIEYTSNLCKLDDNSNNNCFESRGGVKNFNEIGFEKLKILKQLKN